MNIVVVSMYFSLGVFILTVFILSIQYITFSSNASDTCVSPPETSPPPPETSTPPPPETSPPSPETPPPPETSPPPPDSDEEARCCFISKFQKNGDEWVSGIEKRCGYLAGKPCEDTLVTCDAFTKSECEINEINCIYDEDTGVCRTKPNGYGGREIECTMYDRMKNMEFDNVEYNCNENDLFL